MRREPESSAAEGTYDWAGFFAKAGSHGWGFFHEEVLLGTIFLRPDPRQPLHTLLSGLWVDETHRGSGLGRRLTLQAIDFAETEAFQVVKLWVAETNHPACLLYGSLGFSPTGRLRAVSRDPFLHLQQYALYLHPVSSGRELLSLP